jgi:hypothetical protein
MLIPNTKNQYIDFDRKEIYFLDDTISKKK